MITFIISFFTMSFGFVVGFWFRASLTRAQRSTGRWVSAKTECPICGHVAIHVFPEGVEIECGNCETFHTPIILKSYDERTQ
jgi:hypothetical protein